jgi:hypothetical protein
VNSMEKYLPIIYVRGYAGSRGAVESTVLIRGEQIVMTDQREEHGSALTVPARSLETGCETLFQHTFTVGIRDSDAGDGRL